MKLEPLKLWAEKDLLTDDEKSEYGFIGFYKARMRTAYVLISSVWKHFAVTVCMIIFRIPSTVSVGDFVF